VFVNNDPDIQEYAVKPLLAKSGPLDNLDVSLRLLYALGKIRKTVYADVICLSQFSQYVQTENNVLSFYDEMTYDFISNLNAITENEQLFSAIRKMKFSSFEVFNTERYGNMIKTGLTLAVTSLLKELTNGNSVEC
jgi:DNA-binding MltR family transcriptional regulator